MATEEARIILTKKDGKTEVKLENSSLFIESYPEILQAMKSTNEDVFRKALFFVLSGLAPKVQISSEES